MRVVFNKSLIFGLFLIMLFIIVDPYIKGFAYGKEEYDVIDIHENIGFVKAVSSSDNQFDFNNDGKIDIQDLATISLKYNLKNTDKGFEDKFNLNEDEIIDIFDLVLISKKIANEEEIITPPVTEVKLSGKELKQKYYSEIGFGSGPYRGIKREYINSLAYDLASGSKSRSEVEEILKKLEWEESNAQLGTNIKGIGSYEIYQHYFESSDLRVIENEIEIISDSYMTLEFAQVGDGYSAVIIGVLFYYRY